VSSCVPLTEQGSPTVSMNRYSMNSEPQDSDPVASVSSAADYGDMHENTTGNAEVEEDDGFGDDFDDFEAGGEGDDFGDFDDGFQGEEQTETTFDAPPDQPPIPTPSPGPVSQTYSIPITCAPTPALSVINVR
jgi:hypothetical protein